MKALLIAGTHSGCGKTTATLAILNLLKSRGLSIQPFKAGPDFIDPGLHRLITGTDSVNLDLWMCGSERTLETFLHKSETADISIIEGVMGFFDGKPSTAQLAATLKVPVVLVVDAYGMAETASAIITGFINHYHKHFGTDSPGIKGVILNRISSERHLERIKEALGNIPVIGYIPSHMDLSIPERHLGLTIAEESPFESHFYDTISKRLSKTIEIEKLLSIARTNGNIEALKREKKYHSITPLINKKFKVALAYDKAFSFYYPENLNLLKSAGAEIVIFSPLNDRSLPEADLVYFGGGYPELYAKELSGNKELLSTLYQLASEGLPIYAECGGLIYISKGIYDTQNRYFPMAGILPFVMKMRNRRAYLGYREVLIDDDVFLGRKHTRYRGHEFHYSEIVEEAPLEKLKNKNIKTIYKIFNKEGSFVNIEGYRYLNTIGSYIHLHFGSNPEEFVGSINNFFMR